MIQRKKLTIFTDVKDNTEIYEVKKIIEGTFDSILIKLIRVLYILRKFS